MDQPAPAYEGEEPYVFVSYSHQDEALVYREIRWLQDQGVRVWYDTQIQAGSEWSDALAHAISGCSRFLYLITPNSVASENCRRELNHAIAEHRPILAVHLQETEVPGGIRLNLDNRQAILKHRLKAEDYRAALLGALSTNGGGPTAANSAVSSSNWKLWLISTVAAILLVVFTAVWLVQRTPEPRDKDSNLLDRSLAVLPLTAVGEDPVAVNLAQTLTEELRAKIAGYQELHTVALLDEPGARELATSYVLRGNVQRLGESLSLRVNLIRSEGRDTVWAQTFGHAISDGISAAPELASSVGRILRRQILVDQMCEPVRRTTRIQEAADAYCAAVKETWGTTGNARDLNLALSQASRAVALDPDIADAYITVGLSYVWLGEGDQMDWREAASKAREALDRSLALDPEDPRALGLKGRIDNLEMNYPAAETSYREMIARDPLLPRAGPTHGRLAMIAAAQGRIDEALEHIRRSLRIDDSNALSYYGLSVYLSLAGDYRGAIKATNTGLDLVDSGFIRVLLLISKVEAHNELGERSKAMETMDEATASAGSQWRPLLARTLAYLGRTEEARELLAALERLQQPPTFVMAETYAQLADDRAFDWIHTAIEAHNGRVVGGLRANPAYSTIRNDPRWAEVMSHLEAEEAQGIAGQNRQS